MSDHKKWLKSAYFKNWISRKLLGQFWWKNCCWIQKMKFPHIKFERNLKHWLFGCINSMEWAVCSQGSGIFVCSANVLWTREKERIFKAVFHTFWCKNLIFYNLWCRTRGDWGGQFFATLCRHFLWTTLYFFDFLPLHVLLVQSH